MKRLSLLCLFLCTQQAQASVGAFEGFFETVAGGGILMNAEAQQSPAVNVPANIHVAMDVDSHQNATSGAGYVGLGYGFQFSHVWFLGLELTAGLEHAKVEYEQKSFFGGNDFSGNVETLLEYDFALLIKPGYVVHHNTLIYGLMGPRWGHFEDTASVLIDTHGFGVFDDAQTNKEFRVGITAGAGITHKFSRHFSAGLEYAYTSYGTWDTPSAYVVFPGPSASLTNMGTVSVSTHSVMGQLAYHF